MLPKNNRLSRENFKNIPWGGKNFSSEHFLLNTAPGKGKNFAVNVSKRISKSAVKRNSLRRRAYSAIGEHLNKWPNGIYLLRCKNGAGELSYKGIEEEIQSLVAQIHKR